MAGSQKKNMFGGFSAAAQQRKEQQQQLEAAVMVRRLDRPGNAVREQQRSRWRSAGRTRPGSKPGRQRMGQPCRMCCTDG